MRFLHLPSALSVARRRANVSDGAKESRQLLDHIAALVVDFLRGEDENKDEDASKDIEGWRRRGRR